MVVKPTNVEAGESSVIALAELWRQNHRPMTIRIYDQFQLDISDDRSFQMVLELVERLENIRAIQKGLDDVGGGDTVSLDQFEHRIREKHGI